VDAAAAPTPELVRRVRRTERVKKGSLHDAEFQCALTGISRYLEAGYELEPLAAHGLWGVA
jgi:hypothetical protein